MIQVRPRSIVRPAPVVAALLAAAVTLAGSGPVAAAPATYEIDAVHSRPGFKIRHFFTKVPGMFSEFSGTIQFDEADPAASSVALTIQAASVDTDNEKRDNHLRSGDFFDAENHPLITFKSTKIEKGEGKDRYKVTGDLAMHGVTKSVVLDVQFMGAGPDPWGGRRVGFDVRTTINRKDFNIVWNQTLDNGALMLGEEVEIEFPIEAVRKAS